MLYAKPIKCNQIIASRKIEPNRDSMSAFSTIRTLCALLCEITDLRQAFRMRAQDQLTRSQSQYQDTFQRKKAIHYQMMQNRPYYNDASGNSLNVVSDRALCMPRSARAEPPISSPTHWYIIFDSPDRHSPLAPLVRLVYLNCSCQSIDLSYFS